jgi:hypothetical protein
MSLNKYQLRGLDSGEYNLWDQFVTGHAHGTLFHTTAWAEMIRDHFGRNFHILALFSNDQLVGGILYGFKKAPMLSAIPLTPLSPYQGLLIKSPTTEKPSSIIAEDHEVTRLIISDLKQHFDYIDFSLMNHVRDVRPYLWQGFQVEIKYTYTFPLNPFEELKKQFSQSLRRKINLALKNEQHVDDSSDTAPLVEFVVNSYRFHHTKPPIPARKMKTILDDCLQKNLGRLYYLLNDGKPVAGLFFLKDSKRVYALFSGIDPQYRDSQFTDYLHAYALQKDEYQGKEFDFLGANSQAFEPFKRSFGGQLTPYFRVWYTKNKRTRLIMSVRQYQHHLYRKLPG